MSKILFINPNKWGRGITHIWIASHSGILKRNNHTVELFDSTFYSNWSLNEVQFQTDNKMYKKTNYDEFLKFNSSDVFEDLQKKNANTSYGKENTSNIEVLRGRSRWDGGRVVGVGVERGVEHKASTSARGTTKGVGPFGGRMTSTGVTEENEPYVLVFHQIPPLCLLIQD